MDDSYHYFTTKKWKRQNSFKLGKFFDRNTERHERLEKYFQPHKIDCVKNKKYFPNPCLQDIRLLPISRFMCVLESRVSSNG